jgi:hypothetical protein
MKSYNKLKKETEKQEELIDRIRYEQRQDNLENTLRINNLEKSIDTLTEYIYKNILRSDN